MAGYTVIYVEDVLAEVDPESFPASKWQRAGALAYLGLKQVSKLMLVTEHPNLEHVQHWVAQHGFTSHTTLVQADTTRDEQARRVDLLERLQQFGALDLLVAGRPEVAAHYLRRGVPTLLLSTPEYTREEFSPDANPANIRSWGELVGELERQTELKKRDERITADIAGERYES